MNFIIGLTYSWDCAEAAVIYVMGCKTENVCRFLARERDLSLLQSDQTVFASHSTPHLIDSERHSNVIVHMLILASSEYVSYQRKASCAI